MKILVHVSLGLVGCSREKTIDVDDSSPDDEIDELAREVMFEMIDWSWRRRPGDSGVKSPADVKAEVDKLLRVTKSAVAEKRHQSLKRARRHM